MSLTSLLTFGRGKNLFLPAHGRGKALPMRLKKLLKYSPGIWDLPELPDIGSTIGISGEISKSQDNAAFAIGAKKGWYGVNGATGLLQSSVLAIAKPGQALLMPRNVHRSIIQACIVGNIRPILFDLPFLEDRCHYLPPDVLWFKKVLDELASKNISVAAVVLINPTYQGYSSEIKPLIEICHKKNWPVLVDESHGAHFAASIDNSLPQSALHAGADLVVHSLHKSCLGLAQTAVLWWQGDLIDSDIIERSIFLLQTSSPSSLLLASCESALSEWQTSRGLKNLNNKITRAFEIFQELVKAGLPLLENQDPLKIILHTSSMGISGLKADDWFIKRGLIAELPEPGTLTFCLGFASHWGLSSTIKSLWEELLSSGIDMKFFPPFSKPNLPLIKSLDISSTSAFRSKYEMIPLHKAVGRISSELISPYPPGIPVILPGELLDQNRVNWLLNEKNSWSSQIPSLIRVVI